MPHEPEQWYKGCEEGIPFLIPAYEKRIFQQVFMEDYCAREHFEQLYTDITKMLHSDIPAPLPHQVIPYADLNFFNTTPAPMTNNPYHPSYSNNSHTRHKRHLAEEQQEFLPLLELQRALDYFSKYGQPMSLDSDTIYAEEHYNQTISRQKRFLEALVRGITSIFKGGILGRLFLE